jgi:lysophospholipase L1-like esterase
VENPIKLQKGDRLVFFGDSITAQGGSSKTGYINLMKDYLKSKYKDLDLELIGAGIGGHKVPNLQARVDKDVIAKKPTIVFIYIGINDVWHADFNAGTPKDKYEAGLKEIIGKIQKSGAKVILCTPSVIGEKTDGSNKHDAKLDEYSDVSRAVAKEMKVEVCDLRKGFMNYLKANNPEPKKKEAGILTTDRVHLSAAGDRFVAEMMLNMLSETLPPAPPKEEKKADKKEDKTKKTVRISVNETKDIKPNPKPLPFEVKSDNAKVIRLESVEGDPSIVRIIGVGPGRASVIITNDNGTVERIEVIVSAEKK